MIGIEYLPCTRQVPGNTDDNTHLGMEVEAGIPEMC